MCPVSSITRTLALSVILLLAGAGAAPGQVPAITSNGSLGPVSWTDGYYTMTLNTDAMTIDIYTPAGGYSVGGACPAGMYTGPGDPDGCARLVTQSGGQDIVVFDFTTVHIMTTAYVRGNRPAAIAATDWILIGGAISVQNGYAGATVVATDGAGTAGSGPGGGAGGSGPGYYVAVDCSGLICYDILIGGGGGGGGGAAAGSKGRDSNVLIEYGTGAVHQVLGGAGGAAHLAVAGPLKGGSGGGSGADRMAPGGPSHYGGSAGGNGGGSLILATPTDLYITGTVTAAGAAGVVSNGGGGGGGGGGGYLALQVGGTLTSQSTATLSAAGGGGGGGVGAYSYGGTGGGGIISIKAGAFANSGTVTVAGATPGIVALQLTVTGGGTGSGAVTSQVGLTPAISCAVTLGVASGTCSQLYSSSTSVTLTPTPSTGSAFTGWGGACTGTAPCVVSMTDLRSVTATFDLVPYPLTVTGSGTGSGTVSSQAGLTPAIACTLTAGVASGACSQYYLYGQSVTLTAIPAGSAFTGWSGACAGTGACVVSVTEARAVTARFVVRPAVTAVWPRTALTLGGTLVTVTGTGFVAGATTVTLGGSAATGVAVASSTQLTALAPAHSAGPVSVAVFTDGGTASLAGALTYVPIKPAGDFDGDGATDVLWRHTSEGHVWIWSMDGPSVESQDYVTTVGDADWEIRGVGDRATAGTAGVLWRHTTTGQIASWTMDGPTITAANMVGWVDRAFDIVGNADYTADGGADVLWRHQTDGRLYLWEMDGPSIVAVTEIATIDPAFEVVASGDFNADGKADILWRHATSGDVWVWLMNGAAPVTVRYPGRVDDLSFRVAGVGDANGDTRADVFWRHTTTGDVWVWLMDGTSISSAGLVATVGDVNYRVAGTGDYNADGRAEVLWRHQITGSLWMWTVNGVSITSVTWVGTVPDTGYQVQNPK